MYRLKKLLLICDLLLICVPFAFSNSYKYSFVGTYSWGDILTQFCLIENCNLYINSNIVEEKNAFVINTNTKKQALQAFRRTALAQDYNLTYTSSSITLTEKHIKDTTISFLTFDNQILTIPKQDIELYKKRDDQLKTEHLQLYDLQKQKQDSIDVFNDKIKALNEPKNYSISFYSFSESALKNIGVNWSSEIMKGALTPELLLNWLALLENQLTESVTIRTITLAVDTLTKIVWGSEYQEGQTTYIDNGIITSNDEYRRYGINLTLKRTLNGINCNYELKERNEQRTLISGNSSALDTLKIAGMYEQNQIIKKGIPYLQNIPYLQYLFSITKNVKTKEFFLISILPL